MNIKPLIGRGVRALVAAAAITSVVSVAQAPSPAHASDVGAAVGLGILGGAVAGAAAASANPYYSPGYYPYGYAPPPAPYYPPYYRAPRSCWDPYYRRYYQC